MGAPVVHFEISSRNAGRAREFYTSLFDWKVDTNNPMNYGLVDTGVKMGINGGIGDTQGEASPSVTFYVQVEDPQAYLDKAVQLGGRVVAPVTEIPGMITFATFADPEGNVVGLVKGPQTPPRKRVARKRRAAKPKKKASKAKRKKKRKARK